MTTFTFSTVTDPLGANGNSVASGINDLGHIVGYYSDSSGMSHGFLDIGGIFATIDGPSGNNGTVVSDITNGDFFVGSFIDISNMVHGFQTLQVVGSNVLEIVDVDNPLGTKGTTVFGISTGTIAGLGTIVGDYTDSSGTSHGFQLLPLNNFTTIDDPLGTKGNFVHGVNDFGQIVGSYTDNSFKSHGFLYKGGTYTTLDDPLGTNGTFAYGINDAGQIVGAYIDSSNKTHSFLYSGHTYTTIDDPLGVNGTTALDINDFGQIVGQYIDGGGIAHGFLANSSQSTTQTIQNDYLAITRSDLPLDQAVTIANSINLGTQTEALYVNGLLSQVANTTIPAVAVEASMYGVTGTSAEITNLTNNFLPAQVANATANGFNPQVYACEALGLAFSVLNETGSTAFSHNFGPSNSAMPNTAAGDANFATVASVSILGSASTANLVSVMQNFVSNWKAFYTAHGLPGNTTPTADQIDLAARGAAWGDMVGVALATNLGPLSGQVTNFLEDAAQGTALYGTSLVGQPAHQPFA